MSKKLFDDELRKKLDISKIIPTSSSINVRRGSLSPPRRNPEISTRHQYECSPGQLYTVAVYDKDHENSPYVRYLNINVPGREFSKGRIVFQLEKIKPDSKNRYNVDIYRQQGEVQADITYPDERRKSFKIEKFIAIIQGELVSRQEFVYSYHNTTDLYLA